MPPCISLSTFPVHDLYTSLCTCPMHASRHFAAHVLYACLYAFHCLLSLRMPLCISLSTSPCMPLCISLSTFSVHASILLSVLAQCMPLGILLRTFSMHAAFHCLRSLRMPFCISLSTFPVHAHMHFFVHFPCACSHTSLCTCPMHASSHFAAHVLHACLYAFHCLLSVFAAGAAATNDPCRGVARGRQESQNNSRFCTSTTPIPAEGRVGKLKWEKTVFALRPRQCKQGPACGRQESQKKKTQFLHLDHADPRRGSRTARKNRKNPQFLHLDHADPRRGSRTARKNRKIPQFCTSTTPIPERISFFRRVRLVPPRRLKILILRQRASFLVQVMLVQEGMQDRYAFHCVLPYARVYALHCLLSLRMPLCISLSTCPTHASMHFTVYFSCACP